MAMWALVLVLCAVEDTPQLAPKLISMINNANRSDLRSRSFFLVEVAIAAKRSIAEDMLDPRNVSWGDHRSSP